MSEDGGDGTQNAIVLDYLPHGRADDDRPQYQKPALGHAIGLDSLGLYELVLADGADVSIGDRVPIRPPAKWVESVSAITHDELSRGARSELEHVVAELIDRREDQFVAFFNEAGAISLRLHQFNLLPGIGDTLRDALIEARDREPFESLDDLEARVSGLHDVRETLVERLLAELRDEDVKYKLFVRAKPAEE